MKPKHNNLLTNVRITNPRRKKQIEEFVDNNHSVMHQYYEIIEQELSDAKLEQKMKRFIDKDPDFYDPYTVLTEIYDNQGKETEAFQIITQGFTRAMKRIVDFKGQFPQELPWGWLENRHLIRIIYQQAHDCWSLGDTDSALYLFRNLFHSNPHDNIGARNDILAIRMGLTPDYNDQFITKDTLPGCIDGHLSSQWFDKNSKKFTDEFDWWWKIVEPDE